MYLVVVAYCIVVIRLADILWWWMEHAEVVELLLQHIADVNVQNSVRNI